MAVLPRRLQPNVRFIIVVQSSILLAVLIGNYVCWNTAIVKVTELHTSPLYEAYEMGDDIHWANETLTLSDSRIDLDHLHISLIFSCSFIGSALGIVPVSWMIERYGCYKAMIFVSSTSVLATLVTPLVAITSFPLLLLIRVWLGLAQTCVYPLIGVVAHAWAPRQEKGLFVGILTSYSQICAILTTLTSTYVVDAWGWPAVFYAQASICGIAVVFWIVFFRDTPETHPYITASEIAFIRESASEKLPAKATNQVSVLDVLQRPSVWAACLSMGACMLLIQFSVSFLVMQLVWVEDLSIPLAGTLATISMVVQLALQNATGIVSDKLRHVPEGVKVRVFNSLAFFGTGVGLIAASFLPLEWLAARVAVIVAAFGFLGFNCGGYPKSAVVISEHCQSAVMACMQTASILACIAGAGLVPTLTPTRSLDEYNALYRLYGVLLIVANAFFLKFAGATPEIFSAQNTCGT